MEYNLIIWLQSFSNNILDVFMQGISYLASWLGTICVLFCIIFFVNKKIGLYFSLGFLLTIGINYCIKEIIARPRPYQSNPEIINKLTTIGKSFPSGHSVSVMFMVLLILFILHYLYKINKLKIYKKVWFRIICYFLCTLFVVLTAISRMYLGQHYLSDIITGLLLGALGFIITWLVIHKKLVKNKI